MKFVKLAITYLLAVVTCTLAASLVQTQFNLAAIAEVGAPISLVDRLRVTGQDLIGFTPTFGPIVAVGFLVAFLVTALIRRYWAVAAAPLYALAGATAIGTILIALQLAFGITTLAAARGAFGVICLLLTGALGGWTFAIAGRGTTDRQGGTRRTVAT